MGDEILAAGQAQRLFDANGVKVAITDGRGRVRWSDIWQDNPAIATPEDVKSGMPLQYVRNGPNCRPYLDGPLYVERGQVFTDWQARDHRGKLYLTAQETAGAPIGDYWLIEPSPVSVSNPNKRWPFERFQKVVEQVGTWVQAMHPESVPLEGVHHVSVSTFREACGVLSKARGYLGTEGGLHHAAAALGVPAVVIFGGCSSVHCTGYPEHVNLVDDGPESPCGRWVPCEHCRKAMDRITVEHVHEAVSRVRFDRSRCEWERY